MNTFNKSIFAVVILSLLTACGGGSSSDSSAVEPEQKAQVNTAPTSIVAEDFSADENTSVSLDGSASYDTDGTIDAYSWSQISGPSVTLSGADQAVASFTAPEVDSDTTLGFELTVTDNEGAIHSDTLNVTIVHIPENQAPTAVAADDFSANENTTVSLDGSASFDTDGTIASYSWTQVSGPEVTISNADQAVASFTAPEVDADSSLGFQLTVTDNDGAAHTDTINVTINNVVIVVVEQNQAPVAVTANDFSTDDDTTVVLNGSASNDPDGTIVTYSWVQTAGINVSLYNSNKPLATFVAPVLKADSQLSFQLTVTDDDGATSSDTMNVTLRGSSSGNQAPFAAAGSDVSVDENAVVTLNGNASGDSDGSITGYSWTQLAGPTVSLSGANQAVASFTAPEVDADTQLRFYLTVTDNEGATDSDTINVLVNDSSVNQAPVAVVANDFSADENTTVSLDGNSSSDSDGSITSYAWTQISGPSVTLSFADRAVASFVAPEVDADAQVGIQLTPNLTNLPE